MNGNEADTLAHGPHRYGLRVYYEDTDAGGVVYHARYLHFMERARGEALRDLGVPTAQMIEDHALGFVVRRCELDYAAPARLDDWLIVQTEVMSLRSSTVVMRQSVLCEGGALANRPLVVAVLHMTCVGQAPERPGGLRAAAIPPRWRAAMMALAADHSAARQKG